MIDRLAKVVAWGGILAMIACAVAPIFNELTSFGGHDWDTMVVNRHLVIKSIKSFHQFPFWNPYACGGHPAWANVEGDTTVVSPFFPLYFLAPLQIAQRVEVTVVALFSAIGTWLLAGRFTRSAGLRLFACALYVVNGRWALQAATGHLWHVYYAWTPFVLYFFDRAVRAPGFEPLSRARLLSTVWAGAFLALMVYTGAIYPLPQTILLLGLYALGLALTKRSWRPIGLCALAGVISFGLAAPKLLPIVDNLSRFPRHTDSPELLSMSVLAAALVTRGQNMGSHPAPTSHWGWHEWGMYIGWIPLLVLLLALALVATRLERQLRAIGLLFLLIAAGSFHEYAPWSLLRSLPIFSSQHVPSRWMYPSILVLGLAAILVGERLLGRMWRGRSLAEFLVLAVALWIAVDVGRESAMATAGAFWMRLPPIAESVTGFHQEQAIPAQFEYERRDWAPSALGAQIANVGVINCNTFPGLNIYAKDASGVIRGLGAIAKGDPRYRGEAYLLGTNAPVSFVRWSPNEMVAEVRGGTPGDLVVLNQNWDPSWKADGERAMNHEDKIAARLSSSDQTITFRYRPRSLPISLVLFAATLGGVYWLFRRYRRPRISAAPKLQTATVEPVSQP